MTFEPTQLAGAFYLRLEPHVDARGFFARTYCPDEIAQAGIAFTSAQINLSRNTSAFTLRGLHYQEAPRAEAKIVRPTRGRIFDVAIDLRPDSPTFRQWTGRTLDAETCDALFIPEGCAHGFLTLADDTDVLYQMGRMYETGHARGVRWDDPAIGILWPAMPQIISNADRTWPLLT